MDKFEIILTSYDIRDLIESVNIRIDICKKSTLPPEDKRKNLKGFRKLKYKLEKTFHGWK